MKLFFLIAVIVVAVVVFLLLFTGDDVPVPSAIEAFAQCLAEKQVTMYGAVWCSHCQNEKNRFGSAWKLVPYVECPDNPQLCLEKGVEGFPTWILPDGRRLEGEQGLARLSQESGCPL